MCCDCSCRLRPGARRPRACSSLRQSILGASGRSCAPGRAVGRSLRRRLGLHFRLHLRIRLHLHRTIELVLKVLFCFSPGPALDVEKHSFVVSNERFVDRVRQVRSR